MKDTYNIALIPGDGIGPEIVAEARAVLDLVGKRRGYSFDYKLAEMGGVAYDSATASMAEGEKKAIESWDDEAKRALTLPQKSLDVMDWARDSGGAVLFGSVGRPDLPKRTAELALLAMRARYSVVNNRPFIIDPSLAHNSILFREAVNIKGFEVLSPPESLFGGSVRSGRGWHSTEKRFTRSALERCVKDAFELALKSGRRIMCTSKYNVLQSEKMLSDVFEDYLGEYHSKVEPNPYTIADSKGKPTGQLIIDNAAMQIAANPERYADTVVVADAMFGEFLMAIVAAVAKGADQSSPSIEGIKREGIKRTFIRELCSGLYFGESAFDADCAFDTFHYGAETIEDLASVANRLNSRLGLSTVDSLEVDGIPTFDYWAKVLEDDAKAKGYSLRHMKLREGVEMLLGDPAQLGTIVATNMMGDLYTDLAAAVVGKSLGMMPSSAVNADGFGIYEQIAGSAPDIAGKGLANPIAEIRSAAMMLEDLGDPEAAQLVESAIQKAISTARTADIWEEGMRSVSTSQMGELIRSCIEEEA